MSSIAKCLAAGTTTAALVLSGGGQALAAPLEKGHFHDVFTDFFDCDGTPTRLDADVSGSFTFVKRGPGLAYRGESAHGTLVFTNLDSGGTYTDHFTRHDGELKITDNGDGTLTILGQGSGSDRWYDTDGNLVLHDAGQVRSSVMIDHNGTPGDPFDDEEIEGSFQIVKGAGRGDTQDRPFCEDLVLFTT